MADAAENNGAKDPRELAAEIKAWRKQVHERMAVVRDAAARWQRLAESKRR
jgi:hypothetical protein